MDRIITIIGCTITLSLATYFGVKEQPAEMGLIIVCGALCITLLNIDKMQRIKGAGFEAEMKQTVAEVNATLRQLRSVATSSGKAVISDLMCSNFVFANNLPLRVKMRNNILESLKEIGVSQDQLSEADEVWKIGMNAIFATEIRKVLEAIHLSDNHQIELIKSFFPNHKPYDDVSKWRSPTPEDIELFVEENSIGNDEVTHLLREYSYFRLNGQVKDENIFNG